MRGVSPELADRLGKLLLMLSSDRAGEVAAAAAAITRTLASAGADWHRLADAIRAGLTSAKPKRPPRPRAECERVEVRKLTLELGAVRRELAETKDMLAAREREIVRLRYGLYQQS